MKTIKLISLILLVIMTTTGCPGYIQVSGSPYVYYRDSVDVHIQLSSRGYYVPSRYERRMGQCDIPGYRLMISSGLCEHHTFRHRGRFYHRLDPIDRYPNCDRYYRGHLLPEGRYYCR